MMATLYRLDINFPKTINFYMLKIIAHTMSYSATLISPTMYIFSNNFETHTIETIPINKLHTTYTNKG